MQFDPKNNVRVVRHVEFILEAITSYDDGSREVRRYATEDRISAIRFIDDVKLPSRILPSVPFHPKSENTDPDNF
jgi:hypothetical protein